MAKRKTIRRKTTVRRKSTKSTSTVDSLDLGKSQKRLEKAKQTLGNAERSYKRAADIRAAAIDELKRAQEAFDRSVDSVRYSNM